MRRSTGTLRTWPAVALFALGTAFTAPGGAPSHAEIPLAIRR